MNYRNCIEIFVGIEIVVFFKLLPCNMPVLLQLKLVSLREEYDEAVISGVWSQEESG